MKYDLSLFTHPRVVANAYAEHERRIFITFSTQQQMIKSNLVHGTYGMGYLMLL